MRLTLQDRFAHQIDQFLTDPWDLGPVVLAVSGGSDSTALMHLAAQTIDLSRLHVVTVDHGLRDVAAEISQVRAQAQALGLRHVVLTWAWNGQGNLQSGARDGRWAAISKFAEGLEGEVCCLTGHTRDDQAETVLMRLARGSGVAGLAGMLPCAATPQGVRLFRPLLDETREDLQAWLRDGGHAWSDDPSNDDLRFDRVKARQMADVLSGLGLTTDRLVRTASHMQSARRELTAHAAAVAKQHITQDQSDLTFPVKWRDHREVSKRLFRHALHFVSGQQYPPRTEATQTLWDAAQAGQGGTLHGCLLTVDEKIWRISRETAATQGEVPWRNRNFGVIWDGRWLLSEDSDANFVGDLTIRALDDSLKDVPDWRETGLPRASLMASPAVYSGETLVSAPLAGLQNGFEARIVADFSSFLLSR